MKHETQKNQYNIDLNKIIQILTLFGYEISNYLVPKRFVKFAFFKQKQVINQKAIKGWKTLSFDCRVASSVKHKV